MIHTLVRSVTAEQRQFSHFYNMLSSIFGAYILACVGVALAKPEQIRAVQDPIFHFYLQSYPKNGKFKTLLKSLRGEARKTGNGYE